jgi:hypothetical protein
MSDFAPNFTARYRLRYSTQAKSHSMTWRVAASVTDPTALAAKVGLFLDDLADSLWDDFTIVGADFALADSDVFLPGPAPAFGGGHVASGGQQQSDAAFAVSFVGRTIAGGKARMFLYGTNFDVSVRATLGNDWKVLSAEASTVSAAIVRLNETSPALVGNDNETAIWYEYVNMKYNDRWVRRLRRG